MSKTPLEIQCLWGRESALEVTYVGGVSTAARVRFVFVPTASGRVGNHG